MLEYLKYLENDHEYKLNILDLILIDKHTMKPIKWIYTNKNSILKFQYLANITLSKVIQRFLENLPFCANYTVS